MPLFLFISLLAIPLALPVSDTHAARVKDELPVVTFSPLEVSGFNATVQRVQRALIEAGHYKGEADGILREETDIAIRLYQRREELPQPGIADEALAIHIETRAKVQSLLKQLQEPRLSKMDEARKALLARPETHDLVPDYEQRQKRAMPDRNASLCFADPTPKCLFDEASQSATAIFKSELRDWALSEILVAEAKSGMVSKAMETVRLIEDPRLVIVALRDIATAQASAGRSVDKLAVADIIPDVAKRLEALTAIATIQAKKGNLKGPQKTARLLLEGLAKIEDGLKRISLATGAISILTKAGESEAAEKELFKIRIMVNAEEDSAHSSAALRHLASALVELGRPEQALALLSELPDASENTPVLISAAAAQAEAGHAKQAISTAHTIEAVRYRAVILSRIALAQTKAGDRTGGRQTVETALQAASPTLTNV